MKITELVVFQTRLLLMRPLMLKGQRITHRECLLLRLRDDHGNTAWGEVSPLPGFSTEHISDVTEQIHSVRRFLMQRETLPEQLEKLDGGFDILFHGMTLAPSVRFGIETAILQLLASQRRMPFRKLLSTEPRDTVAVNGLLSGTETEIMDKTQHLLAAGYRTFKLKVGQRPLPEDVTIIRWLRETVGTKGAIRLDANRNWDMRQAIEFADAIRDVHISYIEEPVRNYLEILQLLNNDYPLPLALDESLAVLKPEVFPSLPGVHAVVIKPTLHGFERSMRFARAANNKGMAAIISSAFESNVGLAYLAELAACVNLYPGGSRVACGLGTADWFAENVQQLALPVHQGAIILPQEPITQHSAVIESLTEPVHG